PAGNRHERPRHGADAEPASRDDHQAGDAYVIRDSAGSRNGTFVNGRRLEGGIDVELRDGDEVRFGLVKTTFRWR
ncbi:MAG: FHA domain-containing protein, partial [Pseudanabaena sp. CRU_2_10]|nr:FHA domain-containing protein [Pseudanabaena sp. CRU_2_10]